MATISIIVLLQVDGIATVLFPFDLLYNTLDIRVFFLIRNYKTLFQTFGFRRMFDHLASYISVQLGIYLSMTES